MRLPAPVILSSGSPRRKELLRQLVPEFEILVPNVDETLLPQETLLGATERLANLKANAVAREARHSMVIAADTMVGLYQGGVWKILGKPADEGEAEQMLTLLSANTHQVVTGVAVSYLGETVSFTDSTDVSFRPLSRGDILSYIAQGESMDKAGAYALQGGASLFVDQVRGSRSNVIGLPLEMLAIELEKYKVS